MRSDVERRKPKGILDLISLALTTFGVGYLPLAPGTWGSLVGVGIYGGLACCLASFRYTPSPEPAIAAIHAAILISLLAFILLGIWAASRSIELLGSTDSPHAVVDEVIGQLVTFLFIPFTSSPVLIAAGFLFFRVFDIWKPHPIDDLQGLPGGLGICIDDIAAGIYAGIALSVLHAVTLSL